MVLKNCKKIGPYPCFCDYVLWGLSYSHAWKKTHNFSPVPGLLMARHSSALVYVLPALYYIILFKNKQNLFITNNLLFKSGMQNPISLSFPQHSTYHLFF